MIQSSTTVRIINLDFIRGIAFREIFVMNCIYNLVHPIIWSKYWLDLFHYGLVGWCWKKLTYFPCEAEVKTPLSH